MDPLPGVEDTWREEWLPEPRLCRLQVVSVFTQLWAKVGPDLLASSPCCGQLGVPLGGLFVHRSQRRRRGDDCPHKMGKGQGNWVSQLGDWELSNCNCPSKNGERGGGKRRRERGVTLGLSVWGGDKAGLP